MVDKQNIRGRESIIVRGGDIIENGAYLREGTSDTYLYNDPFLKECCDESIKRINKDSTVVDLGAHINLFSMRVSPYCKKVYAYEALKENYIQGLKNIRDNIEFFNVAVWTTNGRTPYTGDANVIRFGEGEKTMETITLEEIMKDKVCDLLKVDIEGCEYEVLLSAPKRVFEKIKSIYVELHPHIVPNRNRELIKWLEDNNYKVATKKIFGWEVLIADKL